MKYTYGWIGLSILMCIFSWKTTTMQEFNTLIFITLIIQHFEAKHMRKEEAKKCNQNRG
jgi:hypothetical protein